MTCLVTQVPAAAPAESLAHFEARLRFETDCWDVHESLASGVADFVLLDVRSPQAFANGHADGAVNLPHKQITGERMQAYPQDSTFVSCAGPHWQRRHKAAVRLAGLAPVKNIGSLRVADEGFGGQRKLSPEIVSVTRTASGRGARTQLNIRADRSKLGRWWLVRICEGNVSPCTEKQNTQ